MRSLQRDWSCLSRAAPLDEMAAVWQAFRAARDLMAHQFRFYRMGGLDQVALESGDDLAHLHELDQKLWVALSCPVKGLELEERTLELLDLDKDGRVRASEILAALRWCAERLKDLGALIPGSDGLPLDAIDDSKPAGKALLGAVRHILVHRGTPEARTLMVADVADVSRVFEGTRFNGDGVIPPDAAPDPALGQVIEDAIACGGGGPDRSGKLRIDRARRRAFFPRPPGQPGRGRAGGHPPQPAELQMLPLARVEAGAALPLLERVNPAWSGALATFQKTAVAPLFGAPKTELSAIEWEQIQPRYAAYEAWMAAKKGAAVEKLGIARIEAILASDARARIEALIDDDLAVAAESGAVADAVRMAHYKRDMHTLLKNFVNFHDFYDLNADSVFQSGTLYLDSRSCNLCVRVDDPASHAILASLSRMYIAYCDLKRPGGQ